MNRIVQTGHGKVEGYEEGGILRFLGIPYAKAERFCRPEPCDWDGVYQADRFGRMAMQLAALREPETRAEYGEECLNLNIYVPDTAHEGEKLPVAVYVHGGGFQDGSSRSRDGKGMIRDHRFIYVSFNYRLGVLGYLYLGRELGEDWQHTGNNGTLDQLMAMKWIYENIGAFGGDRERITLFGESAGAKTQGALLLLPEMKSYCSQVMMASGAWQCIREQDTASRITDAFFAEAAKQGVIGSKEEIFTMDVDKLLQIQARIVDNPGNTCMFGPVADGEVIPLDWRERIHRGEYWSGNAIVGSCLHEMVFRRIEDKDFVKKAPAIAAALFGENAEIAISEMEEMEREAAGRGEPFTEEDKAEQWVRVLSDYMYRTYSHRLAKTLVSNGSRVWYYSFEYGAASHVQDQFMAFDNGAENDALSPGIPMENRKRLAELIYESYVRFFETGDPNWEGIPDWRPLGESGEMLVWKEEVSVRKWTEGEVLHRFPEDVIRLS